MQKSQKAAFDSQANTFEARAGLSQETCQKIVKTVVEIADTQAGDLVVEVGAGTGQIGQWFTSEPLQYLGFDLSAKMLEQFQQHLNSLENNATLIQADANQKWPVNNSSARVIFGSRIMHLLHLEHLVGEIFRVAKPQRATLLMGSIQRQKNGVKHQMREKMQSLLTQQSLQGRQKSNLQKQLIQLCCQRGGTEIEPIKVSQWEVTSTPRQSLESWEGKESLAGIELSAEIKQDVLLRLQRWAEETFGGLDLPITSEEAYLLRGVRLHG